MATSSRTPRKGQIGRDEPKDLQDVWTTLPCVWITSVYGLGSGRVVYEGCNKILSDGMPYKLGKSACQDRARGIPLSAGLNSCNRDGHVCNPIGRGHKLFGFSIVISNLLIEVYEDATFQLLGVDGQGWWEKFGPKAWPQEVLSSIEDDLWVVIYVTEFCRGRAGKARATIFRRVDVSLDLGSLNLGSTVKEDNVKEEDVKEEDGDGYETAKEYSV